GRVRLATRALRFDETGSGVAPACDDRRSNLRSTGSSATMASMIQTNFRIRHDFGKITQIIDIPNLIDIQKRSYEKFLQANIPPNERAEIGLQGVFKSVFPIRDFNGTSELMFVGYTLDRPKYDVDECIQRGMTYAAPIKELG